MIIPKKNLSWFLAAVVFVVFLMPFFVSAHGLIPTPLVPCGGVVNGVNQPACNFAELVHGVNHVISFLLVVAAPIASILFAYAGFLYMTAQGDTGKVSQAHGIFLTVFVGIVIALAAWLTVSTISSALLGSADYSLLEGIR